MVDNIESKSQRIMITNFENCVDYLTNDGKHVSQGIVEKFNGNLVIASVHALNLQVLSRRDDLISLTYLLVYLIQGHLCFVAKEFVPDEYQFNYVLSGKNKLTPQRLCSTSRAKILIEFVTEIDNINFQEKPNYDKLRNILK